ncbi:POK9 protein, partial [Melanocharis versteri]|nr:POK9 protein [Melanocharis versteri]
GSLGLDLTTAVGFTIIDARPVKVPTGVQGPLTISRKPVGALLLGQSSASMKGLYVLPGLIDADFTREICIMVHTLFPPAYIPKDTRIAQLIPLPLLIAEAGARDSLAERGSAGFGSTGTLTMLTLPTRERPVVDVTWASKGIGFTLPALLDTGADITIMS